MAKDFDIERLRGSENYHTWKFAVKNLLAMKELSEYIEPPIPTILVTDTDGTEGVTAVETNREIAKKMAKAKGILILSVESSIYVHVETCKSAYDVWTTLQKLFDDSGLSRKVGLLRNLISTRLEIMIRCRATWTRL